MIDDRDQNRGRSGRGDRDRGDRERVEHEQWRWQGGEDNRGRFQLSHSDERELLDEDQRRGTRSRRDGDRTGGGDEGYQGQGSYPGDRPTGGREHHGAGYGTGYVGETRERWDRSGYGAREHESYQPGYPGVSTDEGGRGESRDRYYGGGETDYGGGQSYGSRGGRSQGYGGGEPGGRTFGGREAYGSQYGGEMRGRDYGGQESSGGREYGGRDYGGRESYAGRESYGRRDIPAHAQGSERDEGRYVSEHRGSTRFQDFERGAREASYGRGEQGQYGQGQYGQGQYGQGQYGPGQYGQGRGGQRSEQHRGRFEASGQTRNRSPLNYKRSDQRVYEDICDCLGDEPGVDVTSVEIKVENGEVQLGGTVESRDAKRHIEELIERIAGVKDVNNQIKVQKASHQGQGTGALTPGNGSGQSDKNTRQGTSSSSS